MSSKYLRTRLSAPSAFRALALGLLLTPAMALAEPSPGNPLIADVTLQPGGLMVVTGKGYGATNFIAMDRAGEVLVDRLIQVEGPTDQLVTVYRGVDRESYTCMPICQRRVTLGDGDGYFKSAMEQAGRLSNQASGAASAKPSN